MTSARTLYICYFGLREPLVQTQVLPYLRELAAAGIDVSLLTFEPARARRRTIEDRRAEETALAGEGIRWFHVRYHKRPPIISTLFDVLRGTWAAVGIARRNKIDVLHARSHVPVMIGLIAKALSGCRLIFDIRGLMAEEYADAGIWAPDSLPFRGVKKVERMGMQRADHLVVLTKRLRDWIVDARLASADRIEVIPCCVDVSKFTFGEDDAARAGRFEVIYAGSVTGLYMLEEMARFFWALRELRPDAFLRILTPAPAAAAEESLRRAGLDAEAFWVGYVPPPEVPASFRRAKLGLSFRKPAFSQIAASPTKIPEYLAAGVPVVCNAGVGDMDKLVTEERVGVVVESFSPEALAESAARALRMADDRDIRTRCRRVARQFFDLAAIGGAGYLNVYRRVAAEERGQGTGNR